MRLVGWLAGWLVGWLAGWLVGWLAGWLVGWLAGWLVGWLVRFPVSGFRLPSSVFRLLTSGQSGPGRDHQDGAGVDDVAVEVVGFAQAVDADLVAAGNDTEGVTALDDMAVA